MANKHKRTYIVYDARAIDGDTDNANVLCYAGSLAEAKRDIKEFAYGGVVYSYLIEQRDGKNFLVDEQYEWSERQWRYGTR